MEKDFAWDIGHRMHCADDNLLKPVFKKRSNRQFLQVKMVKSRIYIVEIIYFLSSIWIY